ncbi:MAG: TIGR03790 family protein [Gammaproteobacteria bacterium]
MKILILLTLLVVTFQGRSESFNLDQRIPFQQSLGANELAIIINKADPLSATLGEYYVAKRKIPRKNVIYINFAPNKNIMSKEEFAIIKRQVDEATPFNVQAYALTWVAPFRVGCMSITTAFAMGFDPAFCAEGCKPTRENPYFNSLSRRPWSDFGIRPTMSIAATSLQNGISLIRNGVAADFSYPAGTAYLVSTYDKNRNVRSHFYPDLIKRIGPIFDLEEIKTNTLKDKDDVFFYFTGLTKVKGLDTLTFLPGAIADHLTSAGGILTGSGQMSALRWLEAGATGSYGAVVEPCNYVQKFPLPTVVMQHYLHGNTLIEAYWKSVAWPGQGIFIGEPLAKPFSLF